ncbi:uncharacterized protein LOC144364560 [Saccoglossus kowalevskii]
MYTVTAKEQRISPTKVGVHGELGNFSQGLMRRESAKLGVTVRGLEKERNVMLSIGRKDREGLLHKMHNLQRKLGAHGGRGVLYDKSNHFRSSGLQNESPRRVHAPNPREFSDSLPNLPNVRPSAVHNENEIYSRLAMNRPKTCSPRQQKISRQRIDELSRPKSAIDRQGGSNQVKDAKKYRVCKQEVVKAVRRQRIDVNRSPISTPVDSPKLSRVQEKTTKINPNFLEFLVNHDDSKETDNNNTSTGVVCATKSSPTIVQYNSPSPSFELALDSMREEIQPTRDMNQSINSNSISNSGRTSPTSSCSVSDDTESRESTTPRRKSIMRTPRDGKRSPNTPRKSISFAIDFEPGTSRHNSLGDIESCVNNQTIQSNAISEKEEIHQFKNYWTWEELTKNLDKCRYLRLREEHDNNDDIVDIEDIFEKSE